MFTQFTCNGSFISHTSYVLVVQKSCLIETALLRTKNICCGLVKGGLNDVYSIFLKFYKPHIICFGCSKEWSQ